MFITGRIVVPTFTLAGLLVVGASSLPASARQDLGPVVVQTVPDEGHCSLARVGTQFVRCDNLTGNGVPAPGWVPRA
jgi:hypothetical protein